MLKIAVFAYNFPHRKSSEFIIRLAMEGLKPVLVIGADAVTLDIPRHSIRTKIRHLGKLYPAVVCKELGIEYIVADHNTVHISPGFDLGIIAGARILKPHVIDSFPMGIINFHPGLIPENRGLDAMLWAVKKGLQQGITAHLIDHQVDAGKVLFQNEMKVYRDDTPLDFQERLYEMQLEALPHAVDYARRGKGVKVGEVGEANRKMNPQQEKETIEMFGAYVEKHVTVPIVF